MKNVCAIYARYSNVDKRTEKDEYQSITNQIKILTEYAKENNFIIYDKYFDHHVSGANFNRDGLNKLIEDAKAKKFSILLVKDLSRFGRNYIEVGKYINDIFPDLGIRFIAVNDEFDSSKEYDESNIALKNVLNHIYLKDIGRKIRKATAIRLTKEMCRSRHYGYIIKNKIAIIYEPEAKIVRRIFEEASNNKDLTQIYIDLNNEKIPCPCKSYSIKMNKEDKTKRNLWILENIKLMIQDEFYTGVSINAKTNAKSTDKRNIRVENTHPAIIPKELFDKVNKNYKEPEITLKRRESLRHMLYCKKCLARNNLNKEKAAISLTEKDGKYYYHDNNCNTYYPYELFNKRVYDELLEKYLYIRSHKEEYINKCLIELSSTDGKALEYYNLKIKYQNEFSEYFEKYMTGEISENTYNIKSLDLKNNISKCNEYINHLSFDNVKVNLVTNKVNKFINTFYESDKVIDVIKEFIDIVLYDQRNGKLDIILKLETEIDLPSSKLENIIIPEVIRRKDFDLRKIILDILKEHPFLKIKGILSYAREIWDGFNYNMIKKTVLKLQNEGKIKTEPTKSKMADGYMLMDYNPDDFDYHNLEINRILKECYKFLYNNPKSSYADIAKYFNVSKSQARTYVRDLRDKNAFTDPRFDKSYIPYGSTYSIYVGHQELDKNIEANVLNYLKDNPTISRYKLKEIFNITEGQARKLKEQFNKENVING